MKKTIKKLVAVMMMGAILSVPVFAKNGDKYYSEQEMVWYQAVQIDGQERLKNQSTGVLSEKNLTGKIYTYEIQEEGTMRTASVILKNGVAMVEVQELAKAIGVNYAEEGNNVEFYCYVRRKEDPSLMPSNILISKKNNKYWAETSEIKRVESMYGSWSENVIKEGVLTIPIQVIDGKTYVPAREVIDMINQKETKITYDKSTKTITFKQMREWYKLNSLEESY